MFPRASSNCSIRLRVGNHQLNHLARFLEPLLSTQSQQKKRVLHSHIHTIPRVRRQLEVVCAFFAHCHVLLINLEGKEISGKSIVFLLSKKQEISTSQGYFSTTGNTSTTTMLEARSRSPCSSCKFYITDQLIKK